MNDPRDVFLKEATGHGEVAPAEPILAVRRLTRVS
jgi:hypothetical protein